MPQQRPGGGRAYVPKGLGTLSDAYKKISKGVIPTKKEDFKKRVEVPKGKSALGDSYAQLYGSKAKKSTPRPYEPKTRIKLPSVLSRMKSSIADSYSKLYKK